MIVFKKISCPSFSAAFEYKQSVQYGKHYVWSSFPEYPTTLHSQESHVPLDPLSPLSAAPAIAAKLLEGTLLSQQMIDLP